MTHTASKTQTQSSWTQLGIFVLVISLGISCVSCRQEPAPEGSDQSAKESQTDMENTSGSDSDVVARVNGHAITHEFIEEVLAPFMQPFIEKADELPDGYLEQRRKEVRKQVVEKIIIEHLFDEKVKEKGIKVTDNDVDDEIFVQAFSQEPEMTVEEYLEKAQAEGKTVAQFKAATKRQLEHDKLMEQEWAGKLEVTEDKAQEYYDKNPGQFQLAERVRARHILIAPEKAGDPEQAKAAALAQANQLLGQIRAGADFAELAKAHSSCSSSAEGGNLDYFRRGQMVPAFEKAAFSLEPGKLSDVVESQFGFHIIEVLDHKEAGPAPFAEVKENIIEAMSNQKQTDFIRAYIEMIKGAATIEYVDPEAKL